MSLSPFVFIGVGGTGGKTLGVIRQSLADVLDRFGWQEGWPGGWQFVHIDVPSDPDAKSEHTPYSLSRREYVALTDARSTYANYAMSVSQSLRRAVPDAAQRYQAWESWQPYPASSVRVNIRNGAGQYRAIGRVCALEQLSAIDRAVAAALRDASAAGVAGQLLRIQGLTGENAAITRAKPVIFVIGSVAGGSGSGMLLDVCDVIRARGQQEVNAVVFTPEVFAHADGSLDPGVAPNTFMALNEITNAMWTADEADAPLSRDLMFARAGVSRPIGHGGPSTVFLVGRRNGAISLKLASDVYRGVGRSLAELALNEQLTNDVVNYDLANSQAVAAGGADGLQLSSARRQARDLAVFRSLGFSRLSVGRDFFEKYAVDRMCRAVTLRLIDGHLLRRRPDSNLSDEELLNAAVEDAWEPFLHASQLDEAGAEQNDISDRLRTLDAPQVQVAIRDMQAKCQDAIKMVAVRGRVKTIDAGQEVAKQVRMARPYVLAAGQEAVAVKAIEFQDDIQRNLAAVISDHIAEEGLPVTSALLKRLIAEARLAEETLAKDVATAEAKEQETLRSLSAGKAVSDIEFPLTATERVEDLLTQAKRAIGRAVQAQYYSRARDLVVDLIDNLLRPWERAIRDADGLLRGEARPANQDSVLDIWPSGDVPGEAANVPDYVRPSQVEFLMDEADSFPVMFEKVIEQSVVGAAGVAAVDRAVREVASGKNLGKDAERRGGPEVVDYRLAWSPAWEPARKEGHPKAAAQIQLNLSLADIRRRAHDWLWDDEKSSGRYLRTTLGQYLTDPQAMQTERNERKARLLGQFQAMILASQPLVAIDPAMAQKIHGHAAPPFNMHMTPLNVPSALAPELADIAQALLNSPQEIVTTTNPKSDAMMMTLLREPYHMVEVASVMDPITEQWTRLANTKDFWLWRRARPLPEWTPLNPLALADLVRGWFMARLTGRAQVAEGGGGLTVVMGQHRVEIGKESVRPARRGDHVGVMVEGLAVAFLEAYRSRSLDPIGPYRALIALGGSYEETGNELLRWIEHGGRHTPPIEYEKLSCDVSDSDGRRAAALELVSAWIESYGGDLERFADDTHQAQGCATLELNTIILNCLEEIRSCLRQAGGGFGIR